MAWSTELWTLWLKHPDWCYPDNDGRLFPGTGAPSWGVCWNKNIWNKKGRNWSQWELRHEHFTTKNKLNYIWPCVSYSQLPFPSSPSVVWQVSTRRMAMLYPSKKKVQNFRHSAGLGCIPVGCAYERATDCDPECLHMTFVKAPCFFSEVKVAKKHRSVKYINQFFHFCWWFRNPGTRLSSCYGRQCLNPPFLWLSTWLFSEKPADFVYDGFLLRFLLRTATPTQRTARTADRTHPPPCENVGVQTVEEWDCFSIFF